MADRVATYRRQLTPDHGFSAVAAEIPDLVRLGVSHLYLSPIAEAVPGSAHGYDVTDPTRIREELGGESGFAELANACRAAGIGIVVDVVPNHLAAHPANPWWWDLLRLGRRSPWAAAFDIDWDPPKRELRGTVLLPVLGDHFGRELENGALRIERGDGSAGRLLVIRYHDHEAPLSPTTTGLVLAGAARRSGDDVLGVAARLLARVEAEPTPEAVGADLPVAERTAAARLRDPSVSAALDEELAALATDLDALETLFDAQHHRLAWWRVANTELDYRRFFDIDSLVATRVERPEVFEAVHALPLRLVAEGHVDGLRIDHVDGLRDPEAVLTRLRAAIGDSRWLLVEKILRDEEALPPSWPVDGTTGYEVADLASGVLVDPDGAGELIAAWRARTGDTSTFRETVLAARREVLFSGLTADLERLTDALVRVCEARRRHRDHTRAALRDAVAEVLIHVPTYRSYVRVAEDDPARVVASAADLELVESAIAAARSSSNPIDPELLDLLAEILAGRVAGAAEAEVALRFQQLSGPLAAKGEEDTALYRWTPLPGRCEVGADPGRPAISAGEWHAACLDAQARWPQRLTTLTTHDTKRSAEVRARLAVLTTCPAATVAAFDAWWTAAAVHRDGAVDARCGWLLFHTLVSADPLPADRAWAVMEKSLREAKLQTSWTDPDEAYESAVRKLVEAAIDDRACAGIVEQLAETAREPGWEAGLAQLAIQLLAPGIPDVYQGGEGWDLSLVDPDNRRNVDPAWRRSLLDATDAVSATAAWLERTERDRGVPRAHLLRAALALRARQPEAVGGGPGGAYVPLACTGAGGDRLVAFVRGAPAAVAVAVCRPFAGAGVAADTTVDLPAGRWVDILTGVEHSGGPVRWSTLRAGFPVAVLERSG